MKKLFWIFVVAMVALSLNIRTFAAEDCDQDPKEQCKKNIKILKTEINLFNLINGLHLTTNQIEKLLGYAKQLNNTATNLGLKKKKREFSHQEKEKMVQFLEEVKEKLLKEEAISPQMRRQYQEFTQKNYSRPGPEAQKEYMEQMEILENKARDTLTPAQRDVMSTYKACLIPPKNLKDPVRIGQADTNDGAYRILVQLRKLPTWKYDFLESALMDRMIDKYEHHFGKYNQKERMAIKNQIITGVRKARTLTDVQFELQKNKLCDSLKLLKKIEMLKEELEGILSKNKYVPGKIARFLLCSDIIPIYQSRIQLLKTRDTKQTDMRKVDGVKDCNKCAVSK